MEFRFTMTLQDYIDYNIFAATQTPEGKQGRKKYLIRICSLYVASMIIFAVLWRNRILSLALMETYLIIYILIVFRRVSNKSIARRVSRNLTKRINAGEKLFVDSEYVLTLGEDCIHEVSKVDEQRFAYSELFRVYFTLEAVYLFKTANDAYILPARVFTPDKRQQLIDFLSEKLPADKLIKL